MDKRRCPRLAYIESWNFLEEELEGRNNNKSSTCEFQLKNIIMTFK
jgi:hypothetical protein